MVPILFELEDDEGPELLNKVEDYAETIVPSYTDRQFKAHFRICPATFENILNKLHYVSNENNNSAGNPGISIEKQLMIALWYLSNMESFRGVADRFGISKATAWHALYNIGRKLLAVNMHFNIIALDFSNSAETTDYFQRKTGFPGIVGVIDGTHIPIKAPIENNISYLNRKNFHSVILQGVCNHKRIFLDCYAGEAGSIHDACMFRRSEFGRELNNLRMPANSHFLGDSAYPLLNRLLVPYKDNGHLTPIQHTYNTIHSKSRVYIEQTFALLKGRFRRLKLLETVRLDLIPLLIINCCILHNIAQTANDIIEINMEAELMEEQLMNANIGVFPLIHEAPAREERDDIAFILHIINE